MYCFISTLVFSFHHLSGQNLAAWIHSFHLLVQYTRMEGGGVNCRQSARIQHPAFSCDLAFSHMLHRPVTPPKILCEKGGVRCYSEIFDRRPVSLYIFGPDNCQPLNRQLSQPDLLYTHKINPVWGGKTTFLLNYLGCETLQYILFFISS